MIESTYIHNKSVEWLRKAIDAQERKGHGILICIAVGIMSAIGYICALVGSFKSAGFMLGASVVLSFAYVVINSFSGGKYGY